MRNSLNVYPSLTCKIVFIFFSFLSRSYAVVCATFYACRLAILQFTPSPCLPLPLERVASLHRSCLRSCATRHKRAQRRGWEELDWGGVEAGWEWEWVRRILLFSFFFPPQRYKKLFLSSFFFIFRLIKNLRDISFLLTDFPFFFFFLVLTRVELNSCLQ